MFYVDAGSKPAEIRRVDSSWWRDRHVLAVHALTLVIVLTRSVLMLSVHSASEDDNDHLHHGLMFYEHQHTIMRLNDPPFGEMVAALPMILTGCVTTNPINPMTTPTGTADPPLQPTRRDVLDGERLSADTILMMIAIWKSLLFVPFPAVVFAWCRRIYGLGAGWLAASLFLCEPNFAANIPVAACDVLAVEMIVITCLLWWRYYEHPSVGRVVLASVAMAFAMQMKNTAILVPAVVVLYALCHLKKIPFSRLRRDLATALVVWLFVTWAECGFDISAPYDVTGKLLRVFGRWDGPVYDAVNDQLIRRWPMGIYLATLVEAMNHAVRGHWAVLWGENRAYGWWYYFFAVATYKVPLGVFALMAMALFSLRVRCARFAELSMLIPAAAYITFLCFSPINVGFRHFLPAYAFIILLVSRSTISRRWSTVAGGCVAYAAMTALWIHPDYHAYINFPRYRVYDDITDSNLDWGQGARQVTDWVSRQPTTRPIWIRTAAVPGDSWAQWHGRATNLGFSPVRPTHGLLVISPVWIAGDFDTYDAYAALRNEDPDEIIGHSTYVFDLDRLVARGFHWLPFVMTERRVDWAKHQARIGQFF